MAFGYHHFVVVFNKTGTGEVFKFPIDSDHTHLTKSHPAKEEWPEVLRLRDFGLVALDNRLYVLGGYDKETDKWMDTVRSYNPKIHEWMDHAPMMTPRDKFVVTVVEKKIIVAGGERAEGKLTTMSEIYDPETDEWTRAGTLPKCRTLSSACSVGDVPYMSGGYLNDHPKDNIWMNERVQTWTELDDDCPQRLTSPTAKHCMVAADDKIYFIGGIRRKRHGSNLEPELVTVGSTEALRVRVTTGMNPEIALVPREKTGIPEDADTDDEDAESTFWQQEDVICPWDLQPRLPDMIHARHGAAALVLGRRIYVFGGVRAEGGDCRKVEYLDIDTRTWHEAGSISRGNIGSVTAVVLVFANPEDREYELMLEQKRKEGIANDADDKKYRWIMW